MVTFSTRSHNASNRDVIVGGRCGADAAVHTSPSPVSIIRVPNRDGPQKWRCSRYRHGLGALVQPVAASCRNMGRSGGV